MTDIENHFNKTTGKVKSTCEMINVGNFMWFRIEVINSMGLI
jgi:hypothetical protein